MDSRRRMRIGELAQEAGVRRETIHFYLREGLLPTAEKVNARVSYFDQAHLTRLRLIKALQQAHIPLAKIREQLEGLDNLERMSGPLETATEHEHAVAVVTEFLSVDGDEPPLSPAEVADQSGLTLEQLAVLEELGVLEPQVADDRRLYTDAEAEVARAVRTIIDQGVEIEKLRFVRRYAELIQQEHGFLLHHLILPAFVAGRRREVSATLANRALRVIEAYLRRQFRRRILLFPPDFPQSIPPWPDPLAGSERDLTTPERKAPDANRPD